MSRECAAAFAPGRVNLIGEHTDYNGGLALPFSIAQGITVCARRSGEPYISAHAADLGEDDRFGLRDRSPARGWRAFVRGVVDSGERHAHASSGYNERRSECERASRLLGVRLLAEAQLEEIERLAEPLRSRARHVIDETRRVEEAVAALRADDLQAVAALLNASQASLRDCYEVSTAAMERTVRELLEAGAAGARMIGGGFGGSALAAFAPGIEPPAGALYVRPGDGAHVLGD